MASASQTSPPTDEPKGPAPESQHPTRSEEKPDIPESDGDGAPLHQQETSQSIDLPHGPIRTDTTTALKQAENPPPPVPQIPSSTMSRITSTAIGPSSDLPTPLAKDSEDVGPVMMITLLLTNGARHPFKLDGKYLVKRGVNVHENDPYNLSVYKLKELILREWREEWESKPSSPSAIRLISFGKLLDDKSALKDLKLSHDSANVLHMTIKPQDFIDDEDTKGGKSPHAHGGEGTERRNPGCRCVIM